MVTSAPTTATLPSASTAGRSTASSGGANRYSSSPSTSMCAIGNRRSVPPRGVSRVIATPVVVPAGIRAECPITGPGGAVVVGVHRNEPGGRQRHRRDRDRGAIRSLGLEYDLCRTHRGTLGSGRRRLSRTAGAARSSNKRHSAKHGEESFHGVFLVSGRDRCDPFTTHPDTWSRPRMVDHLNRRRRSSPTSASGSNRKRGLLARPFGPG